MSNAFKKLLSVLLTLTLLFTQVGVTVFAESGGTDNAPLGASNIILEFAPLPDDVAEQAVPFGTSMDGLTLPDTLAATVTSSIASVATPAETDTPETDKADVPVASWVSAPDYNPETAGTYNFTALLPQRYDLADGVSLPVIAVTVESGTHDGQSITFDIELNEYGETAFYLSEKEAIAETDLLAGVSAVDETGGPVTVTVQDTDELDMANPQMRGAYPNPPYIITYAAAHPATGDVFTVRRELYVTLGEGAINPLGLGDYDASDVAAFNAILTQYQSELDPNSNLHNDPDNWAHPYVKAASLSWYVVWSGDSPDKRITQVVLPGANMTGTLDVSGLTALETLICVDNEITGLNLSGLTNLQTLYCENNNLTTLNVSGLANLTRISCYNNEIANLTLTGCSSLETLFCHGNKLSVLNLNGLTSLKELACSENELATLDASDCTNLVSLDSTFNNQLVSIDVSGCTSLSTLICNNNALTTLDLTGCTAIELLICYTNQLTDIDLTGFSNLTYLDCFNNRLTTLELSGCTALEQLYCNYNSLTSLDVSDCSALEWLYCFYNYMNEQSDVAGNTAAIANFSFSKQKVSNIIDVPSAATVGTPLILTGKVIPNNSNIAFQSISWSVKTQGTTGATISGGNTLNTTATGTVTVTATVEHGLGYGGLAQNYTQDLNIVVSAAPVAPTITTTSLPGGTVGTTYSQTLAAIGDTPITWSVESGNLPSGLSLNANTGEISGTPTTAETRTFTVKALNSADNDTKSLSITVNASPVTVTSVTIKTAPAKTTYMAGETLDLTGLVVTLNKSDASTEDVAFANFASKGITTNPTNGTALTTANTSVTITCTTDNKTVNQAITVNAVPVTVTSVTIKTAPTKTTYTAGETLDLTGLVVTLNKSDASTEDVAFANFASKGITTNPTNGTALTTANTSVTITCTTDNKTVNQAITVNSQTYTISGIVTKEGASTVDGATVTIMRGNESKGAQTTQSDGVFSFTNIAPGLYNLVIESGSQKIAVIVTVTITNVTIDQALTKLPQHIQNSKVEVTTDAPVQAVVGGLPEVYNAPVTDGSKGFTQAELNDIAGGATGEIKVVVDEIQDIADQTAIENAASGKTVGLFIDLSVFKSIDSNETQLTELPSLLTITFDLPAALQGKTISAIYRVHGSGIDTITTSGAEYFSQNGNTITFYVKKFSTYGLAYTNANPPAPPAPPAPDRDSGSSGGGLSKSDNYTPAPHPWLESTPAQTLATSANKAQQDFIRTKSTDRYGVRKASWLKLKGYRYYHDTIEGNAVQVRLYIDNPTAMTRDIYVTGFVKGSIVESTKAFFEKWFINQIRVIHMDESAPWGQEVRIAAKVDLASMDTKKLYLYSYDKKTNKYTLITNKDYKIDKNGYLHFTTQYAGDIVISENRLQRK